jgi:HD-like signal output (HDOD) protein
MTRLADHCAVTGQLARLVCRHTAMMDEHAFLCGLLHDVGTAACIIAVASHRAASRQPAIPFAALAPILREVHESASERLAELWQLPGEIRIIIGHHHSLSYKGMIHPLSAVVCVADALATELGHGMQDEVSSSSVLQALSCLKLSRDKMDGLRTSAKVLLEKLAASGGKAR